MDTITKISSSFLSGHWIWITQAFVIITISLLLNFFQGHILLWLRHWMQQKGSRWANSIADALSQPLTLLIWVLGITLAADVIYVATQTAIFAFAGEVRSVGVILSIAWFLTRLIQNIEQVIVRAAGSRPAEQQRVDQHTAEAIGKLLRVSVFITAALVTLQTLGFSISGVLAFGGLGGIVIGWAARDFVSNFFGGLTIYLDRPFHVGDWVRSPDREIEGTVEEIGWRQTRIRTFDKRPIYVPNSIFTTIALENPSRMTHRRIYEHIGIRYNDIKVMDTITREVETMLREHSDIADDQTMIVKFNAFSASSVDFMLYTFTRTVNWIEFHRVKQDVLLKVVDIITSHGAELAFPTRTLYLKDESAETEAATHAPVPAPASPSDG
ncbi:MAG: mechanosensitive ion channel family protein [Halothiobacillaceae bacterium]